MNEVTPSGSGRRMPALVKVLFVTDFALAAAFVVGAKFIGSLGHFSYLVDVNNELNVPTWYSSVQLFLLGFLLVGTGRALSRDRIPHAWLTQLLACAFIAMSFDEFGQIHERLGLLSDALLPGGDRAGSVFPATGIWMFVVAIPVFLAVALLTLAAVRSWNDRGAVKLFGLGLLVLALSAAGTEVAANLGSRPRVLQGTVEELGEMLAVTIMVWGVTRLMATHGVTIFGRVSAEAEATTGNES